MSSYESWRRVSSEWIWCVARTLCAVVTHSTCHSTTAVVEMGDTKVIASGELSSSTCSFVEKYDPNIGLFVFCAIDSDVFEMKRIATEKMFCLQVFTIY